MGSDLRYSSCQLCNLWEEIILYFSCIYILFLSCVKCYEVGQMWFCKIKYRNECKVNSILPDSKCSINLDFFFFFLSAKRMDLS